MRLWSPDIPWLYQMQVSLYDKNGNKLIDNVKRQFGMREFVIDKNSTPKGRMYLNGKKYAFAEQIQWDSYSWT